MPWSSQVTSGQSASSPGTVLPFLGFDADRPGRGGAGEGVVGRHGLRVRAVHPGQRVVDAAGAGVRAVGRRRRSGSPVGESLAPSGRARRSRSAGPSASDGAALVESSTARNGGRFLPVALLVGDAVAVGLGRVAGQQHAAAGRDVDGVGSAEPARSRSGSARPWAHGAGAAHGHDAEAQLGLALHRVDQVASALAGDLDHDVLVALGGHLGLGDTGAVDPLVDDAGGLASDSAVTSLPVAVRRDPGAALEVQAEGRLPGAAQRHQPVQHRDGEKKTARVRPGRAVRRAMSALLGGGVGVVGERLGLARRRRGAPSAGATFEPDRTAGDLDDDARSDLDADPLVVRRAERCRRSPRSASPRRRPRGTPASGASSRWRRWAGRIMQQPEQQRRCPRGARGRQAPTRQQTSSTRGTWDAGH